MDPPPPSEGDMAAWLRAIDQADDELPCDDGGSHREQMATGDGQPAAGSTASRSTSTGDNRSKKEKLPTREGTIRTKVRTYGVRMCSC